ncbi:PepSY domain-containing protein [Planococcus kocurii]|uniref:PepSY domain-containing protein n=1 Tax=Planococcus TaxID=1372 RepID=UPI00165E9A3A|nr:PepSY domain-containing protein [Planococcus sp. ANT_H30]
MRKWILMTLATILLGGSVIAFLLFPRTSPEISEEQAEETVISLYGGSIEQTTASGEDYQVEFQRTDGRYLALVNRQNGQVESMKLLKKTEKAKKLTEQQAEKIALEKVEGIIGSNTYNKDRNEYTVKVEEETQVSTLVLSAATGGVLTISEEPVQVVPSEEPDLERIITRNEAIRLAKKTLSGEVQDDEFVETEDGGYYLIEIENDETDQEATIQIHAVRGDTMTVEWDN